VWRIATSSPARSSLSTSVNPTCTRDRNAIARPRQGYSHRLRGAPYHRGN
jgi:hypothetical protein